MDQKNQFGRSATVDSKDFGQFKVNDSMDDIWRFSFFWKMTEGNLAPRSALNPCYVGRNFCWDTCCWKKQLEKTRSWEVWSCKVSVSVGKKWAKLETFFWSWKASLNLEFLFFWRSEWSYFPHYCSNMNWIFQLQ